MTMKFDEHQAIREGWSLFETQIPGRWEEIERLDCPADSDDSLPPEPAFNGDDAALEFVIHQARLGSKYHIEALAIHCAEPVANGFPTTGDTFTEEDARLHAAALDLLDVVQEFCHDVQAIGIELDDWPDLRETFAHAVAALRKAMPGQKAVKEARNTYRIEPGHSLPGMDDGWAVFRADEGDETEELVAVITTKTAAEDYIESCHGVLLCEPNPPSESPV